MDGPADSKNEQLASCSGRAERGPQAPGRDNLPRRSLDTGACSPSQNRVAAHGPFAAPPGALRDAISAQQPIAVHSPDITCHLRPIVSAPQPRTPSGTQGGTTQKKLEYQLMSPTRKTAAKTTKWNYSVSADGTAAASVGGGTMPRTPTMSGACGGGCGGGGAGSDSAAVAAFGGNAAKGKGLRLPVLAPMPSAEVSPTSAAVGALNQLTMAGTPVGLNAGLMDPRSPPS